MRRIALILFTLAALSACNKDKLSDIPRITFLSLTPNTIQSGSSEDTANLFLSFADGDVDLGGASAITLIDSRTKDSTFYDFPTIEDELRTTLSKDGLKGEAVIQLQGSAILARTDSLHLERGDTLTYEVYVRDQAGHESNHILTTPLFIRP